jgi:hypothetical protein
MKNVLILFICLIANTVFAHESNEHAPSKQWFIAKENKTIKASFMLLKNDTVYLENEQAIVIKYHLSALTAVDKTIILGKSKEIEQLNSQPLTHNSANKSAFYSLISHNAWLIGLFVFVFISFIYSYQKKERIRHVYSFLMVGFMVGLFSFSPNPPPTTDPLFVDSAFIPFKSKIKTRWDANYFYVESLGLPTHPMMKGITNWQQQVPTPKCYIGVNAWSIPLNPIIAATPTPTATNFFKGAIALATNGHCGKGDDYHYHVAPLSLDSINADILPIAFALDGFAVYAAKEPNGLTMNTLDVNHGHYFNGVYHYHGTVTYPYMVGNMVGAVTKDATDQIVPQPTGNPFRPAGNPLNGAAITNCVPNGTNGYNLTYTLSNQTYMINYSWTNAGVFTFNFVSPTATTTSNYNGQICTLATKTDELMDNSLVHIYPNPAKNSFSLNFNSLINANEIQAISIINNQGQAVFKTNKYQNTIEIGNYTEGVYFVKIQFLNTQLIKKLIVQ